MSDGRFKIQGLQAHDLFDGSMIVASSEKELKDLIFKKRNAKHPLGSKKGRRLNKDRFWSRVKEYRLALIRDEISVSELESLITKAFTLYLFASMNQREKIFARILQEVKEELRGKKG